MYGLFKSECIALIGQAAIHLFGVYVFIKFILVCIIGADAVHVLQTCFSALIMTMHGDNSTVQLAELSGSVVYP